MKLAFHLTLFGALALCAFAPAAQAQGLINFDVTGVGDTYTGAAVFGTVTSQWNEQARSGSPNNLALFDDSGAATSVKVSYSRANSASNLTTGVFANLGNSTVQNSSPVTLTGLTAASPYSLAIYSPVAATFTVNGDVQTTSGTLDWSVLTQGTNYVLFHTVADGSGNLSFNGTSSIGGRVFSAFQIEPSSATPEPGSIALLIGMATVSVGVLRKRKR